jgi:CDP-diacylglycerol--serine O-phosphatidyltransferase
VKKIAIIPTLLTLGNAVCGFAAVVYAAKIDGTAATTNYFAFSAWLIFAAMIFDALDGYAARLSKTASDFGGQLDSLCDAISFGAAPAFVLLKLGQDWQNAVVREAIAVIAALYMVCAVLRLARFNIQNSPDPLSHKRFKGLPSPGAAGCVASLALLRSDWACEWTGLDPVFVNDVVHFVAPLGTLVVALLMVSRVGYPHATKQVLRGRRHFSQVVQLVLAVFLLVLLRELSLVVLFWGYALYFPARYLVLQALRDHTQPAPTPQLDDRPH